MPTREEQLTFIREWVSKHVDEHLLLKSLIRLSSSDLEALWEAIGIADHSAEKNMDGV